MRSAAVVLSILTLANLLACAACSSVVETVPHGTILCEAAEECEDDNDCTEDTCEAGRCAFTWVEDGQTCSDEDGSVGECAAGVCQ